MIRLATKEDLPDIDRIYAQAVMQKFCTAHLEPVDKDYWVSWFSAHHPKRQSVYVSLDGKKMWGWVSLGSYRLGRQALAQVGEVSYYVDKKSRERSMGSLLLRHATSVGP